MSYDYIWNIDSEVVQSSVPRTAREIALHDNIACSISGGSDSDIMLDIVSKLDTDKKVHYVFFDTGIEMSATKKHLDYLENRYGIEIERIRHNTPIPIAVKEYGYPFISKKFSDYIERLQKHGFQWEDGTFEELTIKEVCDKIERLKKRAEAAESRVNELEFNRPVQVDGDVFDLAQKLAMVTADRDKAVEMVHKLANELGTCTGCKRLNKECSTVYICECDGKDHWEWEGLDG